MRGFKGEVQVKPPGPRSLPTDPHPMPFWAVVASDDHKEWRNDAHEEIVGVWDEKYAYYDEVYSDVVASQDEVYS